MTAFAKDNTSIDQEIEWLREEIDQDQFILDTGPISPFHTQRIMENELKLNQLLEVQKTC